MIGHVFSGMPWRPGNGWTLGNSRIARTFVCGSTTSPLRCEGRLAHSVGQRIAGISENSMAFTRVRSMVALLSLALALASPYWLPVAQLKPLVNAQVALTGGFEAWRNVASLSGVLFDPQAFLAAPFVALALSGAWQGRAGGLGHMCRRH